MTIFPKVGIWFFYAQYLHYCILFSNLHTINKPKANKMSIITKTDTREQISVIKKDGATEIDVKVTVNGSYTILKFSSKKESIDYGVGSTKNWSEMDLNSAELATKKAKKRIKKLIKKHCKEFVKYLNQ